MVDAYAMLANHGVKVPLSLYKLEEPPKGQQMIDPKIADQVKQVIHDEVEHMTHLEVIEVNINVVDIKTESEFEEDSEE